MRPAFLLSALALLIPSPVVLASSVEVHFSDPETFSDAHLGRDQGRGADDFVLKTLQAHIEKLGGRYLRPGQTLRLDIVDIDLAGRYESWRVGYQHVRFMREITWPRIRMHYSFEQDGKVLVSREAMVIDQAYLQPGNRYFSGDRLRYEKAMLDDWFRWNLGKVAPD